MVSTIIFGTLWFPPFCITTYRCWHSVGLLRWCSNPASQGQNALPQRSSAHSQHSSPRTLTKRYNYRDRVHDGQFETRTESISCSVGCRIAGLRLDTAAFLRGRFLGCYSGDHLRAVTAPPL